MWPLLCAEQHQQRDPCGFSTIASHASRSSIISVDSKCCFFGGVTCVCVFNTLLLQLGRRGGLPSRSFGTIGRRRVLDSLWVLYSWMVSVRGRGPPQLIYCPRAENGGVRKQDFEGCRTMKVPQEFGRRLPLLVFQANRVSCRYTCGGGGGHPQDIHIMYNGRARHVPSARLSTVGYKGCTSKHTRGNYNFSKLCVTFPENILRDSALDWLG